MPQSIYCYEDEGIYTYALQAGFDGAKYPYLAFRSDKKNNVLEEMMVSHREKYIDVKAKYRNYEKLAEHGHIDLIEVIKNVKDSYQLFLQIELASNAQFGLKVEDIPRPNASFDLLSTVYFKEVRDAYIYDKTKNSIDDLTQEMLDYLAQDFINEQIEFTEELIKHFKEYGFKSATKIKANERYYNWLVNGCQEPQYGINHSALIGAFDNDQEQKENMNQKPKRKKKIKWKGDMTEFLELLISLQKKGWIEPIKKGEFPKTVGAIVEAFDFAENANPTDTLVTYLKGEIIEGQRFYRFDTSDEYNLKFDTIKAFE